MSELLSKLGLPLLRAIMFFIYLHVCLTRKRKFIMQNVIIIFLVEYVLRCYREILVLSGIMIYLFQKISLRLMHNSAFPRQMFMEALIRTSDVTKKTERSGCF